MLCGRLGVVPVEELLDGGELFSVVLSEEVARGAGLEGELFNGKSAIVGDLDVDEHGRLGSLDFADDAGELGARPCRVALDAEAFGQLGEVDVGQVDARMRLVGVVLLSLNEAQRLIGEDDVDDTQPLLALGDEILDGPGGAAVAAEGPHLTLGERQAGVRARSLVDHLVDGFEARRRFVHTLGELRILRHLMEVVLVHVSRGDLADDSEHRDAVNLGVVEAVDEVGGARAGRAEHGADLAGQLRFGDGGQRAVSSWRTPT